MVWSSTNRVVSSVLTHNQARLHIQLASLLPNMRAVALVVVTQDLQLWPIQYNRYLLYGSNHLLGLLRQPNPRCAGNAAVIHHPLDD